MHNYRFMEDWVLRETANLALKDQQAAQQMLQVLKNIINQEPSLVMKNPEAVFRYCQDMIALEREHFVILMLNTKNKVKKRETISVGSLNATVVHPREVFRAAILHNSASIICVHNHPSGDPTPSPEDIQVAKRLTETGELIGIPVLDHMVIGADGYISLQERGLV